MAMPKKCAKCNTFLPKDAKTCPKCGAPVPKAKAPGK